MILRRDCLNLLLNRRLDIGVICEIRALPGAVIPAKAGIHSANDCKYDAAGLDSRFRGNDQCFEGNPIPNETRTVS